MKSNVKNQVVLLALIGLCLLSASVQAAGTWTPFQRESIMDQVGNWGNPSGTRVIGASVRTTGVIRLLVIPVQFLANNDTATSGNGTFPYRTWGPAANEGYLGNRIQALAAYVARNSDQKASLEPTFAPTVTLTRTIAAYATDLQSTVPATRTSIMSDVVALNDTVINYAAYDIIFLIHSGAGSEMCVTPPTNDLPSEHIVCGVGNEITTNDNVRIGSFCLAPETECSDSYFQAANPGLDLNAYAQNPANYPNAIVPRSWDVLGIWAHLLGHALGLPDLYNTNQTTQGMSLYLWSVMARGYFLPLPDDTDTTPWSTPASISDVPYGSVPCQFDAWSKKQLGWGDIRVVSGLTQSTIHPQGQGQGAIYQLWTRGDDSSLEYFLAENRAQVGDDMYVPEEGLLIYHIDDAIGKTMANATQTNLLANAVQTNFAHPLVRPEPADNEWGSLPKINGGPPDYIPYRTDARTAFPGSTLNHFDDTTSPGSQSYLGKATGVSISNISQNGKDIIATLNTAGPATITFIDPAQNGTLYVTNPTIRILAPGLEADSVAVTLDGTPVTLGVGAFDEITGNLSFSISLSTGTHHITVTGTDKNLGGQVNNTLTFTVWQKTLAAGTHLVSFPVIGVGKSSQVFLGNSPVKLAWWNPAQNSYLTGQDIDLTYDPTVNPQPAWASYFAWQQDQGTPLAPAGLGYWIKCTQQVTLRLNGDSASNATNYVVPMQSGFNMIGSPYNFPVTVLSLQVDKDGQIAPISDAVRNNWIDPVIYSWNGTEYSWATIPNGNLYPWVGYWLRVPTTKSEVRLIFSPQGAVRSLPNPDITTSPRTSGGVGTWEITVKAASITDDRKATVILGMQPGVGSSTIPGTNIVAPPAVPGGITLVSRGLDGRTNLLRDMRASGATSSWELEVSGDAGGQIVLTWPNLTQLPPGYSITLRDHTTGEARYMRTSSSYIVTFGPQESMRGLEVTVAPEKIGALRVVQVLADGTHVSGVLTQPASIMVDIRTITGQLVRELPVTDEADGQFLLHWDRKDRQGHLLPHGVYECQVTAVTETGQSAKAFSLFSL